jgi:hypothetical protein
VAEEHTLRIQHDWWPGNDFESFSCFLIELAQFKIFELGHYRLPEGSWDIVAARSAARQLALFSGRRARRVEPGGVDVNGFAMGPGMGRSSTAGTPATM